MIKIVKSVRYSVHQLLGSYELLFPVLRLKLRLREPGKVFHFISPNHDICITGPPRSANTFATHVFRMWNPDSLIAHHLHLPIQALNSEKWHIPCIVLLRNPADTISSLLVYSNLNINSAIFGYINFYNQILKARSHVIVMKFEDLISNPHLMVSRANRKYGTTFNAAHLTEFQKEEVFSIIKKNPTRKKELMIAIPDPIKEKRKRVIVQSVIDHPFFHKASSVYDDWMQFSSKQNY